MRQSPHNQFRQSDGLRRSLQKALCVLEMTNASVQKLKAVLLLLFAILVVLLMAGIVGEYKESISGWVRFLIVLLSVSILGGAGGHMNRIFRGKGYS